MALQLYQLFDRPGLSCASGSHAYADGHEGRDEGRKEDVCDKGRCMGVVGHRRGSCGPARLGWPWRWEAVGRLRRSRKSARATSLWRPITG